MSVIFKEKEYDQFLILINKLLIIILILLVLSAAFHFNMKNRVHHLNQELEILKEEELKYRRLLRTKTNKRDKRETANYNYSLLISLADYAENIIYKTLHFKNNKIDLEAVSRTQNNIFSLIEALENDSKFKKVTLINIRQEENYYFELEALIMQ